MSTKSRPYMPDYHRPVTDRVLPRQRSPRLADVDFESAELRVVARAMERRAARCGSDGGDFDPDDLEPLDFA